MFESNSFKLFLMTSYISESEICLKYRESIIAFSFLAIKISKFPKCSLLYPKKYCVFALMNIICELLNSRVLFFLDFVVITKIFFGNCSVKL